MSLYRHQPIVIDAVKIIYAEILSSGPERTPFAEVPLWLANAVDNGTVTLSTRGARDYAVLAVQTPEGVMEGGPGDYLIQGIAGEIYPCKAEVFSLLYEPVTQSSPEPAPV